MNPRQRRGVLLMILAALGAVAVFVVVLSYVGQVRAQVGNMRPVLQLTRDVPANTAITGDMVKQVQAPQKWTPDTMVTTHADLQGMVAATDLPQGAYMQEGMLVPSPALQQDQREIAIMIDAETGVAGKVDPGSVVDIYAAFPGNQDDSSCAVRVLSSVRVINVGELTTEEDASNSAEQNDVVPVTFALSARQSLELTYAESFAETVRLARIGGVGSDTPPEVGRICDVPRANGADN